MDRLTAFVAISHLILRLQILSKHPELLEGTEMTPKLAGLTNAMATLQHGLEDQASKLLDRVNAANTRTGAAFAKANAQLSATEQAVTDVENFVASLEGSNGGPTLSDSSGTSVQSQPEQLTVNGVSKA